MSRGAYHKELKALEEEVCVLADMAAEAVGKSIRALKDRDIEASKEVVENDAVINKKRFEIENRCLLLLATQQPMAVDLRVIAAILSIITDLERIADHAEGNANISVMIGADPLVKPIVKLPVMAEISLKMLSDCMEAFSARDVESARAVCDEDDKVDALYDEVYKELLMIMIEDQSTIKGATYLMWAAHNMERVADRVTNIAERVVFMVTGRLEEMNVSKY